MCLSSGDFVATAAQHAPSHPGTFLQAIVLALRGTLSLNDLMTDLICTDERFPVVDTDHVFSSVLYDQLMSNTAIWSSSQWAQLDKMRARRIATEHAAAHACPPDSKLPDELSTHLPTAGCATNCGTSRVFHTPTRPVLCAPVRQEHVALQYRAAVRRLTIALGLHQRCGQGRVQRKGKQPAPAVAKWTTVAEEDVERIGIDSLRAAGPCVVGSPLYPRQHSVTGAYAGGVDSHLLAQMTHVWICHGEWIAPDRIFPMLFIALALPFAPPPLTRPATRLSGDDRGGPAHPRRAQRRGPA